MIKRAWGSFRFCSVLLVAGFLACSTPSTLAPQSQLQRGELPPQKAYQDPSSDRVTIAVVGINDFHGHVMPKERKLFDGRVIQSGGAPALSAILKILRDEMKGNVLLVDAGDEWQGTLESNQVAGSIVLDYFNRIGMNVAAIGNHEFDFGLDNLKKRAIEARYPYVASNIFEKKTGARVGPKTGWKNVFPSQVFEVGGIKIGVIGVSTQETPSTTRYDVVAPYEFRDPSRILEQESKQLRAQGASAVLMTSHAGTRCESTEDLKSWKLWTSTMPQGKCFADQEMSRVFSKLKKGSLDGAVLGHTHQIVHHWVEGIPSIEDEAFNQYVNILYLTFERSTRKLLQQETRIEGLIPICTQTFEDLHHCDTRRLPDGFSPGLKTAQFHGKPIIPDADVTEWLKPILASTEKYRKDVLAVAELPVLHNTAGESMFGNLVADVFIRKSKADFALVNARGIRNPLDAGPITADALYRALPFDNFLNVIRLSGKDLKLLLRISTSGAHDYSQTAGLRMKVIPLDRDASRTDLNGDGKLEVWETNRLIDVTRIDGRPIEDSKIYTVATYDFLVNGGDDLSWFMKRVRKDQVDRSLGVFSRDIVADYLKTEFQAKGKKINTREEPLLNPLEPRVILQR